MTTLEAQKVQEQVHIKFIRGATSVPPVKVEQPTGGVDDNWMQVDLVNPPDTNIVFVSGLAEHMSMSMFEHQFWYHQTALILNGEMVIQDLDTGGVYRAREGDLFYWGPGLRVRIGGKFKAFFAKTPIPLRWVSTSKGKTEVITRVLENEISFPGSSPAEYREEPMDHADGIPVEDPFYKRGRKFPEPVYIKFVKGATSVPTVAVDDRAQMPNDNWGQIDLVSPSDTNIVMVSGLAKHTSKNMWEIRFWYHQLALILDGEMVVQDLATGGVYRANSGDLFYWAPGLRVRFGGEFRAFYVKTPVPLRWVSTPQGKKVLSMHTLEGETYHPGSPAEEIRKERLEHA